MTDGVLVTNTTLTFNKSEKESGQSPSKLRMTADTIASFRDNVANGKIAVATEKFNREYQEIRQALIAAETEAAEQQVRATVINDGKTQADIEKEKELEMAQIQEDQLISRLSSIDVVKPRLSKLSIDPSAPDMVVGRNEKGLFVFGSPKLLPKALKIPVYFSKIYKKIGKNSSLYKLADSIMEQTDVSPITQEVSNYVPTVAKVANWRGLFDDRTPTSSTTTPTRNETREEVTIVPTEKRGITKEELADRKVKAQIGDELNQIRRLQKGIAGTSPFNTGLLDRENALLQMLAQITGIKIDTKEMPKEVSKNTTEFQKLIDGIIGYRRPLTEEEHDKKEREMEEHYTNPEVIETMRALQLKNILYDLNTPEAYERVAEAERKDNALRAAQSTMVEMPEEKMVIEDSLPAVQTATEDPSKASMEEERIKKIEELMQNAKNQAKALFNTQNSQKKEERKSKKEQSVILQSEEERKQLILGAEEQAQELMTKDVQADLELQRQREQDEYEQLKKGAEEQAAILHREEEKQQLVLGAEEQARILHTNNQLTELQNGAMEQAQELMTKDVQADLELQKQREQEEYEQLKKGAEEQAAILHKEDERQQLVLGAEEQARMLYTREVNSILTAGAEEQAKLLHANNMLIEIKNGALEQAQELIARDVQVDLELQKQREQEEYEQLKKGAEEQAAILHREDERQQLVLGAEEQARMLYTREVNSILAEGALEQARLLQINNQIADLKNDAEIEARNLYEGNRHLELQEQQQALQAQQQIELQEQQQALQAQQQIELQEKQQALQEQQQIELQEKQQALQEQQQAELIAQQQAILEQQQKELAAQQQAILEQQQRELAAQQQALQEQQQAELIAQQQAIEKQQQKELEARQKAIAEQEKAEMNAQMAFKKQQQLNEPLLEVKKTQKFKDLNVEMTDLNYRYGSIVSTSKPIKVNPVQLGKFRKASVMTQSSEITEGIEVKDMLVSLKEQLEELGLGTSQDTYQDSYSLAA